MTENKWIVCTQTTFNCIKYHTSDGVIKYPEYREFLNNISVYNIKNIAEFKKQIDAFKVIYIDLTTGWWEIVKTQKTNNFSFEEHYKLNEIKENTSIIDTMIKKGKNYIGRESKNNVNR